MSKRTEITETAMTKRTKITEIAVSLYPGRKQFFIQDAARHFRKNPCHTLVESFAGSAVVGLSLLHAQIIENLILVEKDEAVVCLLKGMLNDPTLADRFADFNPTRENVLDVLESEPEQSAFRWLVVSRVSNRAKWWGGLRSDISCRWCMNLVLTNLRRVYDLRHRVSLVHGDAFDVMSAHLADDSVGCFCDPPYSADPNTSKGRTIYRHHKVNHPRLFGMLAGCWRGPWVMTQDDCGVVRRLAQCHRLNVKRIRMNTSDNIIKHELMITRRRPLF